MANIFELLKNAGNTYKTAMERGYKGTTGTKAEVKPTDTYKTNLGNTKQYGSLRQEKTPTELAADRSVAQAIAGQATYPDDNKEVDTDGGYDRYSVYDIYASAIDEQNRLLREQQELARQQREARLKTVSLDETDKKGNKDIVKEK